MTGEKVKKIDPSIIWKMFNMHDYSYT